MLALEFENIEIDWCPLCAGIWLDAGELGLLLRGTPGLPDGTWLAAGRRGDRRCPLCHDRMHAAMAAGSDVEIDACPHRHGLWLDPGELEQLAHAEGADTARLAGFLNRLFPARPPGSKPVEKL